MTDIDRFRDDPEALRRLVEEHRMLKETIENSPILFCVYDPDHNLLAWNESYENNHRGAFDHIRALSPDAPVSYRELVEYEIRRRVPPAEVQDEVEKRVALQAAGGGNPVLRHYESSGWVQVIKYRLPSGATAGMAIDVNDLKRREAELIKARQNAEAAERVKAGFLAKMSHEIRTPMNGILGMAETLIETDLTPEQRLSLETIVASGDSLLTLINDILDFSKIEAGKMELVQRPFSLLAEAEALTRLLMPRAQALGLDLILDVDPGLDVPLIGDRSRIRQILTNLVGNALKFTPKGYVLLRIDGIRRDKPNAVDVTITVQDTGIGIPQEVQDSIFKPFSQLNNPVLNDIGGTGLGLSITSDLVKAMDGTLALTSDSGRGSKFECHLRLAMADKTQSPLYTPAIPGRPPGTSGDIWLIDPCPLHAEACGRSLRHLGYMPQVWSSLTAWNDDPLTDRDDIPIVLSARALPDDCHTVLDRLDRRIAPCLLVWDRPTPPPDRTARQILLRPVTLSDWSNSLNGTQPKRAPPPAPLAKSFFDLTVLVAEDNRTNRLVIDRMLRDRVSTLIFAGNGKEAVNQATLAPPDIIFMDMAMPLMNGLDATRAIRAHEQSCGLPRCPIVALTANAMANHREDCLEAGMDEFLTKPVRMESLLDHIALAVRNLRMTA